MRNTSISFSATARGFLVSSDPLQGLRVKVVWGDVLFAANYHKYPIFTPLGYTMTDPKGWLPELLTQSKRN